MSTSGYGIGHNTTAIDSMFHSVGRNNPQMNPKSLITNIEQLRRMTNNMQVKYFI